MDWTPGITIRRTVDDGRPPREVFEAAKDPKNWPHLHGKEVRDPITGGPWHKSGEKRSARLKGLGKADCVLQQLHEPVLISFTAKAKPEDEAESGKEYRYVQLFLDYGGGTRILLLRGLLSGGRLARAAGGVTTVADRWLTQMGRSAARAWSVVKRRPLALAVVVFLLSWLSAGRGADSRPLWPSIPWSALFPPLVLAVISGLVAFLVARLLRQPRKRREAIGRRIGGGLRILVSVATVAVLSWSVEGLLHDPDGGEWTGLGVGVLLALLAWFLFWAHRRR